MCGLHVPIYFEVDDDGVIFKTIKFSEFHQYGIAQKSPVPARRKARR